VPHGYLPMCNAVPTGCALSWFGANQRISVDAAFDLPERNPSSSSLRRIVDMRLDVIAAAQMMLTFLGMRSGAASQGWLYASPERRIRS
jgi:hypothetical protein